MAGHEDVRIGTLVPNGNPEYLKQVVVHGFESFELNWWKYVGDLNLKKLAADVRTVLGESGTGAVVSCIGVYGNPLEDKQTAKDWARLTSKAGTIPSTAATSK
jgi:hypothetical protein